MSEKEYYYSTDEELFNFESIDELCLDDGDTYYRCERQDIKGSELIGEYSAENIVEKMCEMLYDEVGEVAIDRIDVDDKALEELQQLLEGWADKHAKISCWKAVNIESFTYSATESEGVAV